ncbi:MAG: hypothetical protein IIV02_04450 [Peptococcaceae bacterium]|nr:hypothetical protein [Peptococcaceae bacterium]
MAKEPTEKQLFKLKNEFLQELFPKVKPMDFYRDLFPEGSLEMPGDFDSHKPNMIAATCYRKTPEEIAELEAKEAAELQEYEERRAAGERLPRPRKYKKRIVSNRIIFDDMAELPDLLANNDPLFEFIIIPPVAFSGKNRTKENAYHLWAFAIDLDGVGMGELEDLIHQIQNDVVPEPTYIVNSGHGMHLYYCFEDPVPLYPYLYEELQALKNALTDVVWNRYTSTIPTDERQYQSIVQGYRAVGSASKLGKNYPVTAFLTGNKHTLQYLMEWATESKRVDFNEFKHVTLDEARELWPEWYQYRIMQGLSRKPFKFKHRGVYDSWLQRMQQGAFDGNRYNCIAVLFAVAYKTEGIEFDEVMDDALELVPRLNRLTKKKSNEFTVDDVLDASAYYDEKSLTLSLKGVYRMTKIHIEPNKRNKRKRKDHLHAENWLNEKGRPISNVCKDNRELSLKLMRENGQIPGRPNAHEKVAAYRVEHPEAKKADCHRDTGLDPKTIRKWWDVPVEPDLVSVLKVDIRAEIVKPDGTRIPVPFASEKQK